MSYERLSPTEKAAVDLIFDCKLGQGRTRTDALKRKLGVSESRVKKIMAYVYAKYGIDGRKFEADVRLVYLRAKELRLI